MMVGRRIILLSVILKHPANIIFMKKYQRCLANVLIAAMMACHQTPDQTNQSSTVSTATTGGQENVSDSLSEKDIVIALPQNDNNIHGFILN